MPRGELANKWLLYTNKGIYSSYFCNEGRCLNAANTGDYIRFLQYYWSTVCKSSGYQEKQYTS